MSNNTGGPAFPVPMFAIERGKYEAEQQGISMRDYFAAKALQGLLAAPDCGWREDEMGAACYRIADYMLKAREQ